ncbi:MAG TPA: DUF4349 domain-containing protein [Baekduia sp.]|nr:DUF4349 domain-containing protein [Baekduia sp.]
MSDRFRRSAPEELVREQEELDRALAGDPAAEPQLALLVADVHAARATPDPAFASALDRRVAARFELPGAPPRRRRAVWRLAPAGAVLAGLAAVVLVAGGSEGEGDRSDGGRAAAPLQTQEDLLQRGAPDAAGAGGGAAPEAALAPGALSDAARPVPRATVPPLQRQSAPPARGGRDVERAAELTLTPPIDEVQDVADDVVRETQAVRGYVQGSSVDVRKDAASAQFTLRVPAARLDDLVARLSRLADVGALRQQATDITATVDGAAGRVSEARAERRALLRALGRATTEGRISSLRARLADNRRRLGRLEAQLAAQRRRAAIATVQVAVEGRAVDDDGDEGATWTPRDAAGDAWRVLQVMGGVLLVALTVLLPLALLGLLGRLALRRRREAALG